MFIRKALKKCYPYYVGTALTLSSRLPIGTNVYERNWDALIILDACRVDALKEVASEYDFLEDIDSIMSVGSTSSEWMANTFTHGYLDKIEKTSYLSVNGYTHEVLFERNFPESQYDSKFSFTNWETVDGSDFYFLEESWRYLEGNKYDRFNPRKVTNRAISHYRDADPDKLIIHYNQPHTPYCSKWFDGPKAQLEPWEKDPFHYLMNGGDFTRVWSSYLDEIRFALDQIELLRQNIDAERIAISADHGEAFGEMGIYGHPGGVFHPSVKFVPWTITSGEDKRTHEPEVQSERNRETDIEEHLEVLGYK